MTEDVNKTITYFELKLYKLIRGAVEDVLCQAYRGNRICALDLRSALSIILFSGRLASGRDGGYLT